MSLAKLHDRARSQYFSSRWHEPDHHTSAGIQQATFLYNEHDCVMAVYDTNYTLYYWIYRQQLVVTVKKLVATWQCTTPIESYMIIFTINSL